MVTVLLPLFIGIFRMFPGTKLCHEYDTLIKKTMTEMLRLSPVLSITEPQFISFSHIARLCLSTTFSVSHETYFSQQNVFKVTKTSRVSVPFAWTLSLAGTVMEPKSQHLSSGFQIGGHKGKTQAAHHRHSA